VAWDEVRSRLASAAKGPLEILLRPYWTPTPAEYLNRAAAASGDPVALLREVWGSAAVPDPPPEFSSPARNYGTVWQVDPAVQRFLWALVRAVRPERVLETGVADGASTRALLDAMEANGRGTLYGTDISQDVGRSAQDSPGLHRWRLTVLPKRGRGSAFRALLAETRPLDVFVHDSDHSYPWQRFEYREAWRVLGPGGWLLSDDVNSSYAFLDFARSEGRPFWLLTSPRKLFGILRKAGGGPNG
jgi:predicted O-methyltransferase YrrM